MKNNEKFLKTFKLIISEKNVEYLKNIYKKNYSKLTVAKIRMFRNNNYNKNKKFYIICMSPKWGSGFFASFLYIIAHIDIAYKNNFIPTVDMENFKTLYSEKYRINGTKNVWEYYFEPICGYSLDDIYKSKNIMICKSAYPYCGRLFYKSTNKELSKMQITELNFYIKKYIKLKPDVLKVLNQNLEKFKVYNKIVGVHIRSTDLQNAGGKHATPLNLNKIISKIDHVIKTHNIEGIFVATDDLEKLELLIKKYGDKVIYTDSVRATDGSQTGIHHDQNLINRKNHKYLLGLEVLIDMLMLSNCSLLIGGHSNITYTAMIFNNNQYEKIYLLK